MTWLGIDQKWINSLSLWWTDYWKSPHLYWDNELPYRYPAPFEIRALLERWRHDQWEWRGYEGQPCIVSGALADYLTEHRDESLVGATGPSDPALRLDALIMYLRSRFAAASV